MNFYEYRTLFRVVTLALLLIVSFAFFTSVFPIPETGERFFALALLGSGKMAENYFPRNNSTLMLNEEIKWYVEVYNYVPAIQYLCVAIKLINSSIAGPDSVNCVPSSSNYELMNITTFLTYGRSVMVPFVWKLSNVTLNGNSYVINQIRINNVTLPTNIRAINGTSFRFVFELWQFSNTSRSFQFAWESGFGLRCAWTQLLFDFGH